MGRGTGTPGWVASRVLCKLREEGPHRPLLRGSCQEREVPGEQVKGLVQEELGLPWTQVTGSNISTLMSI